MHAHLLEQIRILHIEIEQQLQHIGQVSEQPHCGTCTAICCKEILCRESMDSPFLQFILGDRAKDYDTENGWLTEKGCRLEFGRPLICYEFFCSKFTPEELERSHASVARELRGIYSKAYRREHILTLDDLSLTPESRLERMLSDLTALRDRMASSSQATIEQGR